MDIIGIITIPEENKPHAVTRIQLSPAYKVVVSSAKSGMIEYWTGTSHEYKFPKNFVSSGSHLVKSADSDRDVFNEKPSKEEVMAATQAEGPKRVSDGAIIHRSMGDINIKLFPVECPKTVENLCMHSRNYYYNGHTFHYIIKGFMIQTGDPTSTGMGGESIWGREFEDEFHSTSLNKWGLRSVHHTLSLLLLPPHALPVSAWNPSHRRQSFTSFTNMGPSHRVQFL
ncbi:peptidylprolyl isomerase domain and WD repeat-containing protein 1-like [Falco peregrinus]|uniref:peptidylprolyl isomerase domain and WD repeat-containing protein 1-like n=1 Tax=Falco peregrinus TaxID=8954 RepID=UPI0024793528|nr:peptidylprolyl isomerase domain and WD repeat-containing protein 1-like [Falco peregrinus]